MAPDGLRTARNFNRRSHLSGQNDPAPPVWTAREARDAIMARIQEISALLAIYVKARHREGHTDYGFTSEEQTRMCDVIEATMGTLR